jgi:NhaA family Na+:H+ antiporter
VVFGLVLGKPVGIFLMGWLACFLGLAKLPQNSSYGHLLGAGILCGIGFTVSIFIAGLAFDADQPVTDAKLGILAASTVAGLIGFVWLWIAPGEPPAKPAGIRNEV